VAPSSCHTNFHITGDYFLGVALGGNVAGGGYTGVLGGSNNEACDGASAIGAGEENVIASSGVGNDSFVGAGYYNVVTNADETFVGAGIGNEAAAEAAFVGAGTYGTAEAPGSFVGAGGYEYGREKTSVAGGGNTADGADSFIGAGDLNQITSNGTGSFIGGGGSADLSGGAHNTISGADSFIGAGDNNRVSAQQAFVGGGTGGTVSGIYSGIAAGYGDGVTGIASFAGAGGFNLASGQDAFVGSGNGNQAIALGSFVGAGGTASSNTGNHATGQDSFVGAGDSNISKGSNSFIGGGHANTASGVDASLAGGFDNSAAGTYSMLPGGAENNANGAMSFAAGYRAEAVHNGSFVWSDFVSGSGVAEDKAANQFVVRASGGTFFYSNEKGTSGVELTAGSGAWANLSDRNAKTDIVPLDDASILARVATLPVSSWQYKSERGVRHVGPMAQDFYAAFGVGTDDRHITSIDEDGVALAAIKALHRENDRLRSIVESDRVAERDEISSLRRQLRQIQSLLSANGHVVLKQ